MTTRDIVDGLHTWAHDVVEATCRNHYIPIESGDVDLIVFKALHQIPGRKTNDAILAMIRKELRVFAKGKRALA